MANWLKKLFGEKKVKEECLHSYVSFTAGDKYKYICQHCQKTVSFGYKHQCDEFEFKQMLVGSPTQSYTDFKQAYRRKHNIW